MAAATHLDQEVVLWFDAGRLFRILAIFPPIELEDPEEDWYYNVRNSPYYYSGTQTTPTPTMTITQPGTQTPTVQSAHGINWSNLWDEF